ncbi:uncharacterized protein LOC131642757 [Vicia villosa]|uniref:uncharacterized protein LOC131642757 n=1 Tax=Vicia villosa TaxID=3911 RepID=UPI00273BB6A9|nr:uncharacterized protein LOC131642757 [Vicia villosa]XP_058768956.1 uncharacterized protein LOC131642757 [Vicia villosa]XP_058768957.1 uncharacterized protein LOC131642757 [Vicia villosa]
MNLLSPKMDAMMDNKNLTDEIDRASERDSKPSGKRKYDKFDVEVEITKNFKFTLGMEFSSLQQFKDVVREHNALNGKKIKFAKNDKSRVRAVCKFNKKCGYVVLVSRVVKSVVFRVKTLCPKHTCGRVVVNKSHRSKLVAKVLAKRNNKEEQPAKQRPPIQQSSTTASKKRARFKGKNPSNVKPTKKKTKKGLDVCRTSKNDEGLEQEQPKVFVDGEPLYQNQEDMLARNTFAEPDSAMNLVATSNEKKRKKKVTSKSNLKKTRTSDRLRALTVRRRVCDGPGNNAKSPIVIDDKDDDDDDAKSPIVIDDNDDDDDGESYDPKVGSCMHALRNWNEISKSPTQ